MGKGDGFQTKLELILKMKVEKETKTQRQRQAGIRNQKSELWKGNGN